MRPNATTVQFLTSQHIDLTPTTQRHLTDRNDTLHPETIYNRYQTSPIFASDGSHSSITERTGAGIALLALDHPLTFIPNLTDQAWHSSFTTPLLFALHLLPPKNRHDTNRCQSRRNPRPGPCANACTKIISCSVDPGLQARFQIVCTTNCKTVRNIHPSITTFYSGGGQFQSF